MYKNCNLFDLLVLQANPDIQQRYVAWLAGWDGVHEFREDELLALAQMIGRLSLTRNEASGFFYSYSIPQIGKEFDLLRIYEDKTWLNIEIKTQKVDDQQIFEQLNKNAYYLNSVNSSGRAFTFVAETNSFYKIENNEIVLASPEEVKAEIISSKGLFTDRIDELFSPSHFLVSPLNSPMKFLSGNYFLTLQQETIKKKILYQLSLPYGANKFIGITGEAGTGKTLLLYDIARQVSATKRVLIVHCGMTCQGHEILNKSMGNCRVVPVKALFYHLSGVKVVFIDEAHRLYRYFLDDLVKWAQTNKVPCVFSFDSNQRIARHEIVGQTSEQILALTDGNLFKLSCKIRTNKEIASFLKALFDLRKKDPSITYSHIHLFYAKDSQEALAIQKSLVSQQFTDISFTPSTYNPSVLNSLEGTMNTHAVIGQEFEKVVMIIGPQFSYQDKKLVGIEHPDPDYIFPQLLFQGLTRTRQELALIVYDNVDLFSNILSIVERKA